MRLWCRATVASAVCVATVLGLCTNAGVRVANATDEGPSWWATASTTASTTPMPTRPVESPARPAATVPSAPTTQLGTVPAQLGSLNQRPSVPPVRITVDGARIDGPVVAVGVVPTTGELAVPGVANVVGWYQYGPAPGQAGSAVLAGHVDYNGRLGVFFRLGSVEPGMTVRVGYADGSQRAFIVVERRLILKSQLPVSQVFARDGPPALILITCGGRFNYSTHHYFSNVVVIARPVLAAA